MKLRQRLTDCSSHSIEILILIEVNEVKNAQGKTKKVGGKLTEEGEKILFKWLSISNQDPTLINSVKLEA